MLKPFLLLGFIANVGAYAHAGFHVQFPWTSRGPNPSTRPGLDLYSPFCGDILKNPKRYPRGSRTFLSFSGHPGDIVTVLYTRYRVPRSKSDFTLTILQEVSIQPSGQLCVNVTIPFETVLDEMGVMYFEARDPKDDTVQHHCIDIRMTDMEALPEWHRAMCAAHNETLIPMPDNFL